MRYNSFIQFKLNNTIFYTIKGIIKLSVIFIQKIIIM